MGGQADRRTCGRGQARWADERKRADRQSGGRGRAGARTSGRVGGRWRTDFQSVKLLN